MSKINDDDSLSAAKLAAIMVDAVPPTAKNGVFLIATSLILGHLLSTMEDHQIDGAFEGVKQIVDQVVADQREKERVLQ